MFFRFAGKKKMHSEKYNELILLWFSETKKSKTTSKDIKIEKGQEANILDAASQGAITGVFLVANIAASLIAILAFVAFLNGMLGWFGKLVQMQGLTFEFILGRMFMPIAWIMGVPYEVSNILFIRQYL